MSHLCFRTSVLAGAVAALAACGGGSQAPPAPASTAAAATAGAPGAAPAESASSTVKVDPAIAPYQKTSGVSGSLSSIGSDTMNNLMTLWGESFSRMYPNVKLQVEGKGSTAPPALIEGTAQFGPMSRQMKPTELDAFEKKFGYKPTEVRTSYDALA